MVESIEPKQIQELLRLAERMGVEVGPLTPEDFETGWSEEDCGYCIGDHAPSTLWMREYLALASNLAPQLAARVHELEAQLQEARQDRFGVWLLKEQCKTTWRDLPQSHWMIRIKEEIEELADALIGKHHHSPEVELKQIASICLNWLEMRYEHDALKGKQE
jgi:hypothetical protein